MAVGWFNGIVVTRTGLPSFIVTLVSMLAVAGLALGVTRFLVGTPNVSIRVDGLWRIVFAGRWGFANISIVWWAAISLLAGWVLFRTQFGNWILATGGEVQAAREAGIRTNRVKIALFVLTAMAAVLEGTIQTVSLGGGEGNARTSLRLQQYHLPASSVAFCFRAGTDHRLGSCSARPPSASSTSGFSIRAGTRIGLNFF